MENFEAIKSFEQKDNLNPKHRVARDLLKLKGNGKFLTLTYANA